MFLGFKYFNHDDQNNFSTISGDLNPIHIDQAFARKSSFGQIVVHGINALLWAIDCHLKGGGILSKSIRVKFIKPLYTNEKIDVYFRTLENSLELMTGTILLTKILFVGDAYVHTECDQFVKIDTKLEIADIDLEELITPARFPLVCNVKCNLIHQLFPFLSSSIDESRVAQIACLSSVVGMQIPGLYSLFVSTEINFLDKCIDANLNYIDVIHVDARFGIVDLLVTSQNLKSKIRAIKRAKPPVGIHPANLRNRLNNIERQKINALVIGGSRGIGAACVKILALEGHDVTFTYNKGYDDALALQNDLISCGVKVNFIQFDLEVASPESLFDCRPSCVFYFATPSIFIKRAADFDEALYKKFNLYYFDFLKLLLKKCVDHGVGGLFYPSTIAIEEYASDMPEYVNAKMNGERLAENFMDAFRIKVYSPRIPRTLTDQTCTNLSIFSENPHEIMLKLIPNFFDFLSNSDASSFI